MAHPVTPTLLIGLGGQGQTALNAVKQRMLDAHGEIPPVIKFVSIDTTVRDTELTALGDEDFHQLGIRNVLSYVKENRKALPWLDLSNVSQKRLKSVRNGAGQIRMLGRLALRYNQTQVLNLIDKSIDDIQDWRAMLDPSWDVAWDHPRVIFFGSIAGGTGGGMLLDLACATKLITSEKASQDNWSIDAYLLLPGVFMGMNGVDYIEENSYAFLRELDFFMDKQEAIDEHEYGDKFHSKMQDGRVFSYASPFDSIMLIDNVQDTGATYKKPEELARMIGEAIYVMTGSPIGDATGNILDNPNNFDEPWNSGKRCWYAGMGVAVLRYPAAEYSAYAELAFVKKLTLQLQAGEVSGAAADPEALAKDFVQTQRLRQGDGLDEIVLGILKARTFAPSIPSVDVKRIDLGAVWAKNENQMEAQKKTYADEASAARERRLAEVKAALDNEIDELVRNHGDSVASAFASALKGSLDSAATMIKTRKDQVDSKVKESDDRQKNLLEKCLQANRKLIGRKDAVKLVLAQYRQALSEWNGLAAEQIALLEAKGFCDSLGVTLERISAGLNAQHVAATNLVEKATAYAGDARERVGVTNAFEYRIYPSLDDLSTPLPDGRGFYGWLREFKGESAAAFWARPTEEAFACLVEYAKHIGAGQNSADRRSLADVVAAMTEEKRDDVLQVVHRMAQPMFTVDDALVRDQPSQPSNIYFVGAEDEFFRVFDDKKRAGSLRPLEARLQQLDVKDVQEIKLPDPERAYFYRRWGCVPAHTLGCFKLLASQYTEHLERPNAWCLHIDGRWVDELPDLASTGGIDQTLWVWALAVSDIEYLQCIKPAARRYKLEYRWDRSGLKDVKVVNLGLGRKAARECFLENPDYVEMCQDHIEDAITQQRAQARDDLDAYVVRLRAERDAAVDKSLKQLLDEEVEAVTRYRAELT